MQAENPNEKGKGKATVLPDDVDDSASEAQTSKRIRLQEEELHGSERLANVTRRLTDYYLAEIVDLEDFRALNPICGICFEEFQLVHSPINASNIHKAASSTQLPFGIGLPCPAAHQYCQACLVQYIKSKIDPSCDGTGSPDAIVFPLQCPGCPIEEWEEGIDAAVATRVLPEEDMVLWVGRQFPQCLMI